jgi:hypothetical protein
VKRALLLTFVVVIGIASWWLLHRRGARPAGTVQGSDTPAAAMRSSSQPEDRGGAVELAPLAEDDPPGTLRLEGMVLGPDDQPYEGAIVEVSTNPPRRATTAADGGFAFDGLLARSYRLVAHAPAGVAGPVTARLGATTDPVILHLRGGATLDVAVLGPDARPYDGATVEVRGDERTTATATGGHATFSPVVPGFYEVVASAPGLAPASRRMRVAGHARVQLVLAAGAPVSGRVVDERGAPVAGARVVAAGSGELRRRPDPRGDAAVSGPDGAWRFAALPAGSFRFVATDATHAAGTSPLVTLDGVTPKSDVVVALAPGATVRGRVVDTARQPVAGARVEIGPSFGRGRGRGGVRPAVPSAPRQAYSDAHGEFVVRGLPRDQLVAFAASEQAASNPVAVDTRAGDANNVEIALDRTAVIAGVVVDTDGQPVEGAQVAAYPEDFSFGPRPRGGDPELTDAGGAFRITGLAPGGYRVAASRSGLANGPWGGRGRRGQEGAEAQAGDEHVRIVLPPEGRVKGTVAFVDGTTPAAYTASVGGTTAAFVAPAFELDGLAPGAARLQLTGPSFDDKVVDVTIEPGKTVDLGAILVARGRRIAGTVVASGQPVAGATVYAGQRVLGGGASNDAPMAGMGGFSQGTKTATTGPDGSFELSGFGDGDLAVIADLPTLGRSTPKLVGAADADQTQLVLELQPYGAITGALRQAGAPVGGTPVTVQSTSTPGALYVVTSGADGAYRFDRLAPDTYKVSATVGNPRRGMHFYSKQADVPPGGQVEVDLDVDPGTVELDATPVASQGQVGMAMGYLANGAIAASTYTALTRAVAAAGAGSSQVVIVRHGEAAAFAEVTPGAYTVCFVPLPLAVRGGAAMSYANQHAGSLAAFCAPATVAAQPATQALSVPVVVPPMLGDTGGGAGAGAAP